MIIPLSKTSKDQLHEPARSVLLRQWPLATYSNRTRERRLLQSEMVTTRMQHTLDWGDPAQTQMQNTTSGFSINHMPGYVAKKNA